VHLEFRHITGITYERWPFTSFTQREDFNYRNILEYFED